MERFVNAARLARSLVPAESADRYLTQAWTIARQEKSAHHTGLAAGRLVRFDRNGHWYQRLEVPMSWTDASAACQALGGHLATPTSAEENDFLFSTFATVTLCWLGASLDDAAKWHWVTSEAWDWQHWAGGEPSNWGGEERFLNFGSSNITFLRKGAEWNDHRDLGDHAGWVLTYPLCEWEGPDPPPPTEVTGLTCHGTATDFRAFQSIHWPLVCPDQRDNVVGGGGRRLSGARRSSGYCGIDGGGRFPLPAVRHRPAVLAGAATTTPPMASGTGSPTNHGPTPAGMGDNRTIGKGAKISSPSVAIPIFLLRTYGRMWNDMSLEGDKAGGRLAHHPICEWEKKPAFPHHGAPRLSAPSPAAKNRASAGVFPETRWTLVLKAASDSSNGVEKVALSDFCRAYWRPVYAVARAQGLGHEDAQDVTQIFFSSLTTSGSLSRAQPGKWTAAVVLAGIVPPPSRALAHPRHSSQARRRRRPAARHQPAPTYFYRLIAPDRLSPDVLYDRHWMLAVIDLAVSRLAAMENERWKRPPPRRSHARAHRQRHRRALCRDRGPSLPHRRRQ